MPDYRHDHHRDQECTRHGQEDTRLHVRQRCLVPLPTH